MESKCQMNVKSRRVNQPFRIGSDQGRSLESQYLSLGIDLTLELWNLTFPKG